MSALYVFQPIARPALWLFSSNPQPPAGYVTLACAAMRRGRHPHRTGLEVLTPSDREAVTRGDLARLIGLYARMAPEQRAHLLELGEQLLEAESPPEVT